MTNDECIKGATPAHYERQAQRLRDLRLKRIADATAPLHAAAGTPPPRER